MSRRPPALLRTFGMRRPPALWIAAVLLVVIGASGLLVGVELLAAGGWRAPSDTPAAALIPLGIACYGAAGLVGGLGVFLRRRWAHRLALVTIAIGLVELAWQSSLLDFDPITLFGVAVWGIVLVLLLLPQVRSAVAR